MLWDSTGNEYLGENEQGSDDIPEIGKDDCGDVALRKMMPIIPEQIKPYILWAQDIPNLFRPKEILTPHGIDPRETKVLVIARVSTGGKLQDIRSPLKQALGAILQQHVIPNFKVIGCLLDFFKNGKAVMGRMFFDLLVETLRMCKEEQMEPTFNAFYVPDFSRMARMGSLIWDVMRVCRYYGLKMLEKGSLTDYANPSSVYMLSFKIAEAENETVKMGRRMSESADYRFYTYRTLPGEHFGFRVRSIKGANNRVVKSWWEPVPEEIAAIKFMYSQFPITPSYSNVAALVKANYGIDLLLGQVESILRTKKYLGIVVRYKGMWVDDPITWAPVFKEDPIPDEIENDLSEKDIPPFKYFIPELKIIELKQWEDVQELIVQKQQCIRKNPLNPNRGHRPTGVGGKSPYAGLIVDGKCGGQFVLYGPSGTRLLACQNKRKKICDQKNSVREDNLDMLVVSGLKEIVLEHMPAFDSAYKHVFRAQIGTMEAEKRDMEKQLEKLVQNIKILVENVNTLPTPTRIRFDSIVHDELLKKERLESLIKDRTEQIAFLSKDYQYARDDAEKWVSNLEALFKDRPLEANGAMRKLIDKIVITDVKDEADKTIALTGQMVLKAEGLGRFFRSDIPLRNFIYPQASTEQLGSIVLTCSVEGLFRVNFKLFATRRRGGDGVWALLRPDTPARASAAGGWHEDTWGLNMAAIVPGGGESAAAIESAIQATAPAKPLPAPFPAVSNTAVAAAVTAQKLCTGRPGAPRWRRYGHKRIRVVTAKEEQAILPRQPRIVTYNLFEGEAMAASAYSVLQHPLIKC